MGGRHSHDQWQDLTSCIINSLQQDSPYHPSRQLVLVPMMVDTQRPNKRPYPWHPPLGEAQELTPSDTANKELREEVKRMKLELSEVHKALDEMAEHMPKTIRINDDIVG